MMLHGRSSIGFAEKRVSINAVISFVIGILLNGIHAGMILSSVKYQGDVPFSSGVIESYVLLLGIFGLLWGILSLDDEKTVKKFKRTAILLNGIALIISIWIMVLGIVSYYS